MEIVSSPQETGLSAQPGEMMSEVRAWRVVHPGAQENLPQEIREYVKIVKMQRKKNAEYNKFFFFFFIVLHTR